MARATMRRACAVRYYGVLTVVTVLVMGFTLSATAPVASANPPLQTQLFRVDVSPATVLQRAEAGMREIGLTPYQPRYTEITRLGYSGNLTAAVQSWGDDDGTVVSVVIAGSDITDTEVYRLHNLLVQYIQTGQSGGAVANPIEWGQNATALRGRNGQRFSYTCPAGGRLGSIWGTGVYTDDSSICTAAVHAGLISAERGGVVTIEIREGQPSYTGTLRNGITSGSWGNWTGSYVFVGDTSNRGGSNNGACRPFDGVWNTNYTPITFRRDGNQVTGRYAYMGVDSTLSGTVTGTVLEGEYSQPTYPDPRYQRGRFRFVLNPDGKSFNGQWWDANGGGGNAWNGTCVEGPGNAGDNICDDPRTLAIMDEWLARAVPPQEPGESLRYEAWGRVVGTSRTATITVAGPPDTRLTRCEWLWERSTQLRSTNNLGTLREYLEQRRR